MTRRPPKMTKTAFWTFGAALYLYCVWTLYTALTSGLVWGRPKIGPRDWYGYADHPASYVLIVGISALVVAGPALAWGGLRLIEALERRRSSPVAPPVEEASRDDHSGSEDDPGSAFGRPG